MELHPEHPSGGLHLFGLVSRHKTGWIGMCHENADTLDSGNYLRE